MNSTFLGRLAASGAVLLAIGSAAYAAASPSAPFKSKISGIPATAKPNQVLHMTLTVIEPKAVPGATIDFEVQDGKGSKAAQKFWEHQNVAAGKPLTLPWAFNAPAKPGTYRVMCGVFGPGWKPVVSWNAGLMTLKVS